MAMNFLAVVIAACIPAGLALAYFYGAPWLILSAVAVAIFMAG